MAGPVVAAHPTVTDRDGRPFPGAVLAAASSASGGLASKVVGMPIDTFGPYHSVAGSLSMRRFAKGRILAGQSINAVTIGFP